jgi:hypothetical protein
MNSSWKLLSFEEANSIYKIPLEIATDKNNYFYGHQWKPEHRRFLFDGPLPMIAILKSSDYQTITLHIHTIPDEAHHSWQDYNPLTSQICGYISLKKTEVADTITLLREHSQDLDSGEDAKVAHFRQLSYKELEDFHLHPELFPSTRTEKYIYLTNKSQQAFITLVGLSHGLPTPVDSLTFAVSTMPKEQLHDERIKIFDDWAYSRITLTKSGIEELCLLLEGKLSYLD